ncbi:MAG: hypothetical protein EB054_05765, partial [Actinobacteria bacterium]|nr:hypothetical protein [Actinomycetota bacterium]
MESMVSGVYPAKVQFLLKNFSGRSGKVRAMKNLSTFSKIMIGFVIGAVVAGGVAVAVTPPIAATKICVDNQTKALFASSDGTCPKNRSLIEVSSGSANAEAIAAAVSPSVVSIAVSSYSGNGTGSGVIYRTSSNSTF